MRAEPLHCFASRNHPIPYRVITSRLRSKGLRPGSRLAGAILPAATATAQPKAAGGDHRGVDQDFR